MEEVMKKAYAKINLGLEVVSKREDGFHNLRSIMTNINLYDELTFTLHDSIEVICHPNICLMKDNLVYKAAVLMQKTYNIKQGIKIIIKKNIPIEAGLAGGSSDAACTIKTLNDIWNIHATSAELLTIAQTLGSDVPFCLIGGTALVEGRGEKVFPIDIRFPFAYVLIKPKYSCKTKDIFKDYIISSQNDRFDNLYQRILDKDYLGMLKLLFNDLTIKVDDLINTNKPSQLISFLMMHGCTGAIMTGSGSAVVGICLNDQQAETVYESLKTDKLYPTFEQVEVLKKT